MFSVEFFESENGEKPVDDFLNSLELKMRVKVTAMMELLQEKGVELRKPYTDHLGDGIFELRVKQGSNITRCLFFFYIGERIIITNGFVKKTQKAPASEIIIAKKRRADFLRREKNK